MDRAEAIELIRSMYLDTYSAASKISLVKAYLEEGGYEDRKINDAIDFLFYRPSLLHSAANVASEHFERKFTIYKLFKIIPLNLGAEEKRLLMVF